MLHVEEENYGRNADMIIKHYIAEGIVCNHSILITDIERKPETIVSCYNMYLLYEVYEKM